MESKYIRADLFWNRIAENMFFSAREKEKIRVAIENEPGEDVKPVVHAHWIKGVFADITCSNCNFPICIANSVIHKMLYCPNCGAEVIDPEEEYERAAEGKDTNKNESD